MALDTTDYRILDILQSDGKITNAELASRVGLTPAPTLARVSKLESMGLIMGYTAELNREMLGYSVIAFVAVIMKEHGGPATAQFLERVAELPEVLECHHIAGEEDYLLKVVASSPRSYEQFLLEKLILLDSVQRVKTSFVLSSPKMTNRIPVIFPKETT